MASSNLSNFFITAALTVGAVAGVVAYKRNDTAEDIRLMLLAKGHNSNQADCVKKHINGISLLTIAFGGKQANEDEAVEVMNTCNIALKPE